MTYDCNEDWHDVNVILVSSLYATNVRLQKGVGGGGANIRTFKKGKRGGGGAKVPKSCKIKFEQPLSHQMHAGKSLLRLHFACLINLIELLSVYFSPKNICGSKVAIMYGDLESHLYGAFFIELSLLR